MNRKDIVTVDKLNNYFLPTIYPRRSLNQCTMYKLQKTTVRFSKRHTLTSFWALFSATAFFFATFLCCSSNLSLSRRCSSVPWSRLWRIGSSASMSRGDDSEPSESASGRGVGAGGGAQKGFAPMGEDAGCKKCIVNNKIPLLFRSNYFEWKMISSYTIVADH